MVSKKRCPECESTQTYFRTKSNDYHCQTCGNNFSNEDKE